MDIKLRVVHICGSLIKVLFLIRTIGSVLMELIREVPSLDDKVVVGESQGCSFEVTLFFTVRPRQCFVRVIVISVVLMLRYGRLVL